MNPFFVALLAMTVFNQDWKYFVLASVTLAKLLTAEFAQRCWPVEVIAGEDEPRTDSKAKEHRGIPFVPYYNMGWLKKSHTHSAKGFAQKKLHKARYVFSGIFMLFL